MSTWDNQPKSGGTGSEVFLLIDTIHFLLIDSTHKLLLQDFGNSGWNNQPKN